MCRLQLNAQGKKGRIHLFTIQSNAELEQLIIVEYE